jgi:hypothetical protein
MRCLGIFDLRILSGELEPALDGAGELSGL